MLNSNQPTFLVLAYSGFPPEKCQDRCSLKHPRTVFLAVFNIACWPQLHCQTLNQLVFCQMSFNCFGSFPSEISCHLSAFTWIVYWFEKLLILVIFGL